LANFVLRCHICLKIPPNNNCGLVVNNEKKHHKQGEIIVFDDSKKHYAFNDSGENRIVLIVDLMRPSDIPKGTAVGGHTSELDAFVDRFR
jgi:beta-hydroxylase